MAHEIAKVYQETLWSWAVVCNCGWKEKGLTKTDVEGRFEQHKRRPHRTFEAGVHVNKCGR